MPWREAELRLHSWGEKFAPFFLYVEFFPMVGIFPIDLDYASPLFINNRENMSSNLAMAEACRLQAQNKVHAAHLGFIQTCICSSLVCICPFQDHGTSEQIYWIFTEYALDLA